MKHSLRIKMAITLLVIVFAAIMGNWFINVFFQERYYVFSKERELVNFYEMMNGKIKENERVTEEDIVQMVSESESKNITTLVVNSGLEIKFYSGYSILKR